MVNTIGLDGLSLLKSSQDKNPPSAVNLGVGFYFLLLLLIYVKSARMNVPNNSIRVIASFTSMVSPPFEGKPYPPKIQLYLYFTCVYISVQVFLSTFLYYSYILFSVHHFYYITCFVHEPEKLKLPINQAQRLILAGWLCHLALQGCPADYASWLLSFCRTEARMRRCVNIMLYEVA